MVVSGVGAGPDNKGAPTGVDDDKSVRTSLAKRTAPSIFSSPAPCSSILKAASSCDVYIRIILTRFGVSLGLACSSTATAPDTRGVETEVPLRLILALPLTVTGSMIRLGSSLMSLLFGAASPTILFPGAIRSG